MSAIQGRSPLVTAAGVAQLVYGGLFLAFGLYVLVAGGEAVAQLFQAKQEVGKVAPAAPAEAGAALDAGSKGLAGLILAMAAVVAGCAIVQGLPLILVGLGVLGRRGWARVLAILFAVLAGLQGVSCLLSQGGTPMLLSGAVLLIYAVITLVGLINRRASAEFSGAVPAATTESSGSSSLPLIVSGCVVAILAVVGAYFLGRGTGTPSDGTRQTTKADSLIDDNQAAFHKAIDRGQASRALELLNDGVNPDDADANGETALARSAARGQTRLVLMLLAAGAQANDKDARDQTPLMRAAAGGHGSVVAFLLNREPVRDELYAYRAQHFASRYSKELSGIQPFRPLTVEIDAQDKEGRTALMLAAQQGHSTIIRQLKEAGANLTLADREGMSAWMHAAAAGHAAAMQEALPATVTAGYLQQPNRQGKTAYELAAHAGHKDVVDALRTKLGGVVPDVPVAPPPPPPTAKTPPPATPASAELLEAVQKGDLDAVQELIRRGVKVEGSDDKGRTPLMLTAIKGDAKMMLVLVTHAGPSQANYLDAVDKEGRTALMHAAAEGHGDAVEALLVAVMGAWHRGHLNWFRHLERRDKSGKTALELAQAAGHTAEMTRLQNHVESSLNIVSETLRKTGLEAAAAEGDLATVEGLLRRNAHRNHRNATSSEESYKLQSPLSLACARGHLIVVKALLDSFGDDRPSRAAYINEKPKSTTGEQYGVDAREAARQAGHHEVVALLDKELKRATETTATSPQTNRTIAMPAAPTRALAPDLAKMAQDGDAIALDAYLTRGGNVLGADPEGRTALMLAAAGGKDKVVLLLLTRLRQQGSAEAFCADKQGRTALIHAAAAGHDATVESLLVGLKAAWDAGLVNWFVYLDHADRSGKNALEQAEAGRHSAVAERLKSFYKEQRHDHCASFNGTALCLASEAGDAGLVKRLLKRGVQPAEDGATRHSALYRAADKGHIQVVNVLLESFGQDDEARRKYLKLRKEDGLMTPLMIAAHNGHILVVQALLEVFGKDTAARAEHVALIGTHPGYNARTAEQCAKDSGHREVVTLLRKAAAQGKD